MKNHSLLLGSLLFLALLTCACTVDNADDEIEYNGKGLAAIGDAQSQEEYDYIWNNLSEDEKEFEYAYEVLGYYYLFAHSDSLKPNGTTWYKQLRERTDYIGFGETAIRADINISNSIKDIYFMFATLRDEYTAYIDPSQMSFDDFLEDFESRDSSFDVGVNVHTINNGEKSSVVVMQVYHNSPAATAGIQVGDTILSIDATIVDSEELFKLISQGFAGNKKAVNIARNVNGERTELILEVTITPYLQPSVTYKIIDSVAVIRILEYANENTPSDSGTYGEFLEALEATQNTKATIIDLRGNPGGDGNQCQAIAAEVLKKDDIISFEYHATADTITGAPIIAIDTIFVTEDGIAKDRYIVFLADENSASCAEYNILGVVTNKKSPVVGKLTYGKGVGYSMLPSYQKGAIIFTNAMVFDRNHQTYHMYGILPDVDESISTAMMDSALAIAKEGKRERTAGYASVVQNKYMVLSKKAPVKPVIPTRNSLGMYKKSNSRPFGKIGRK